LCILSFNIHTVKTICGDRASDDKTLDRDIVSYIHGKDPILAGREYKVEEKIAQRTALQ
jgi:hypothetical protein